MGETLSLPFLSVIVCVYNDEKHIGACLRSLAQQTYPREHYEIIAVDDGSTDTSGRILRETEGVLCLRQENRGPSAARNYGVLHARGGIVVFIDSDCEADPDWLAGIVQAYRQAASPRIAAVGGRQKGHPGDDPFARKVDAFLTAVGFIGDYVKSFETVREVTHNASCNASYRADTLREAGGFREGLFPGEDVDLDRRLRDRGYALLFIPHAVVYHHRADTRKRWRRMLLRYGQASADNVLIHGFFRMIQAVPVAALLAFALIPVFFSLSVRAGMLYTLSLFCAAGITVTGLARRSGLPLRDAALFTVETGLYFCTGFWARIAACSARPFDKRKVLEGLYYERKTREGRI
ncbi:MAG: glycosyltransferase [Alphaproteobacteria bacterium]|uniref:Glycosyltransferase n=1 Tax=Candidatus Nitrobium versatile TaxID=2884831 RepID=A0A953M260_9BACT|nr:glycosyltransferase [Candidatus Nitrobium versatile]